MKAWFGNRARALGLCVLAAGCAGPARAVMIKSRAPWGSPHPLVVQAAPPDGSWVAVCQAREDTDRNGSVAVHLGDHGELFGDAASLYLLSDRHPRGEELDDLVAFDAGGRWLVFIREDRLVLRDMRSGSDLWLTDAGATQRDIGRFVDFDPAGTQLLFARGKRPDQRLVVRELATGAEREIESGPELLWHANFLGDGAWLLLATVPADTNGNGRIDLPAPRTSLAQGPCRGRAASYSFMGFAGDRFERRALRVRGGSPESREVQFDSSYALLVRDRDALRWVTASGEEHEVVPASCRGNVLAVSPDQPAVLVACAALGKPPPLRIYDVAGVHDLGVSQEAHYPIPPSRAPIVVLENVLVDFAQRRAFPRMREGEMAIYGSTVLETAPGPQHQLRFRDLSSGGLQTLTEDGVHYESGMQFGRWAVVERTPSESTGFFTPQERVLLIDIAARRIVSKLPKLPITVRPNGEALVPDGGRHGVLSGPLYWVAPPRGS